MDRATRTWHPATKRTVDALEPRAIVPGKSAASAIYDTYFAPPAPRGMHVRVYANGRKVFCLRYRDPQGGTPARYRRVDLGEYGKELTIDQAVTAAVALRNRLAAGEAPHADKSTRAQIPTVEQLVKDFVRDMKRLKRKPRTVAEYQRLFDLELVPQLGRELVTKVTPRDMQAMHARITDRGAAVHANRAIAYCSSMFKFAIRRGDLSSNPASGVQRTPEEPRDVEPLTDAQAAALGKAMKAHDDAGGPWQATAIIRLLFLTGCRRSEIERLRMDEIDLEARRFIFTDSKTTKAGQRRRDRRPIGGATVACLEDVFARRATLQTISPYVFPSPSDPSRPYSNLDRHWQAIRQAAGLASLHLHDVRHDVGADYGEQYATAVTQAVLGHATYQSSQIYVQQKQDGPTTRAVNRVTSSRATRLDNHAAADAPTTTLPLQRKKGTR